MADKAGELIIELRATLDKFSGDLRAAERAATAAGAKIERSFGQRVQSQINGLLAPLRGVKGAFAALGVTAAAFTLQRVVSGALELGDELQDLSAQVGVGVERLQALQFAAVQSGASAEQLAQGLRLFSQNVGEAAAGSDEARRALAAVGITLEQIRSSSIEDLLAKAGQGLAAFGDEASRNAASTALFGREAVRLGPVFVQLASGFSEIEQAARKAGAVLSQEAVRRLAEANDKFEAASRIIGATFAKAVADAAPLLLDLANAIGATVRALSEFIDRFRDLNNLGLGQLVTRLERVDAALANALERSRSTRPGGAVEDVNRLLKERADILAEIGERNASTASAAAQLIERPIAESTGQRKARADAERALEESSRRIDKLAAADERALEDRNRLLSNLSRSQIQALEATGEKSDRIRAIELEIARAKREQLEISEEIRRTLNPEEAAVALRVVQETTAAQVKTLERELGEANKSELVLRFEDALDSMKSSLSNVVDDMIATGRIDFENLGRALGQALIKGLAEEFVIDPLIAQAKKAVGGFDLGSAIKGVVSFFSGIPTFAAGGIVRQPTLAMVGEAGPEAIVPLNGVGTGGEMVVNIYNSSGEAVTAGRQRRLPGGGRSLDVFVGSAWADNVRRNGSAAKVLEARYGVSPVGVRR